MQKIIALVPVALLLAIGLTSADEVRGKIKKIEGNKAQATTTLTVTVGAEQAEFTYKSIDIIKIKRFLGEQEVKSRTDGRLFAEKFKEGNEITVIYDKEAGKTTIKELRLKN